MNNATEVAVSHYTDWPVWAVILTAVLAVLTAVTTAVVERPTYPRRPLSATALYLLLPLASVLLTWQAAQHLASPRWAMLLYFILLSCLGIGAWRSWSTYAGHGRAWTFAVGAFFVLAIIFGVAEILRRVAATIPTSVGGLLALGAVAVLFISSMDEKA